MEELRKRVPFKLKAEDDVSEALVMDEQEQEQLITSLREQAAKTDERFLLVMKLLIGLSLLIHIVYFINPEGFPLLFEPPISLARLFALVQVSLLANLYLLLTPSQDTAVHRFTRELPYVPTPVLWTLGLSSIAPAISILSGRAWQQTAWWSATLFVTLVVRMALQWIQEGEEGVKELQRLRYNAKGA